MDNGITNTGSTNTKILDELLHGVMPKRVYDIRKKRETGEKLTEEDKRYLEEDTVITVALNSQMTNSIMKFVTESSLTLINCDDEVLYEKIVNTLKIFKSYGVLDFAMKGSFEYPKMLLDLKGKKK